MDKTIECLTTFFNGGSLLNLITFILAILGILCSVYFYFKGKKCKKPTYILKTTNLVRENIQKIDSVDILYSGNKIKNLSVTKVAFWNNGKDTISYNDVAKKSPIRLTIKEDFIFLDAKILFQKNQSNDFSITMSNDNKFIDIKFDYFDYEEGIVLQVFHTGAKSSDISMVGQIKSVKEFSHKSHSTFPLFFEKINIPTQNIRKIIDFTYLISGVFFLVVSAAFLFVGVPTPSYEPKDDNVAIILLALAGFLYIGIGWNSLKRKAPQGFDIFNDEFEQL